MKQLQNDFTTPEQSKRLLELGVPKWTADCYYEVFPEGIRVKPSPFFVPSDPCWSVGRLIEIYHICDKPGCSFSFHVCFPNLISEMIYKIVEAKEHGWIDFSKLED